MEAIAHIECESENSRGNEENVNIVHHEDDEASAIRGDVHVDYTKSVKKELNGSESEDPDYEPS